MLSKEILLVDGYNMIFSWDNLKKLSETNLEYARDKLVHILSDYQGTKKCKLIVVFDGHKVKGGIGSTYENSNITVVYTKESETADNYIERIAHIHGKSYRIKVATSDALEQTIIFSKGATRISARELELDIKKSKQKINKKYFENIKVKENMLCEHLDSHVVDWMEKLRRQD